MLYLVTLYPIYLTYLSYLEVGTSLNEEEFLMMFWSTYGILSLIDIGIPFYNWLKIVLLLLLYVENYRIWITMQIHNFVEHVDILIRKHAPVQIYEFHESVKKKTPQTVQSNGWTGYFYNTYVKGK